MNKPLEADLRWANCGQATEGGWSLAWAQLIGVHHLSLSEDSVAHRLIDLGSDQHALSLAVADGVGGGARGDVASSVLAQHCTQAPDAVLGDSARLTKWMREAEDEVQRKLREVSFSPGASTVVAVWLLPDGSGHLVRVGDARAYCYDTSSDGASAQPVLRQLTKDQTYAYVQETPPEGGSPDDPARMVGTGFMGEPEIEPLYLKPGQTLLLCSDGLPRGLDTDGMGSILSASSNLAEAARNLAEEAFKRGSEDDITVLLAQLKTASNDQPSMVKDWWTTRRGTQ